MKKLKNILNEVLAEASVNEVKAKIEILTAMVDGKDMYSIYVDGEKVRVPGEQWPEFKKMVKMQEGKLNEALPKFKTPAEGLKWVWSKRDEAMDMEQELKDISAEIQQLYGEMEQDAEPGGGPIADRYGRELEALENKHKALRAEYDHVMTEIDEFDQYYIGY